MAQTLLFFSLLAWNSLTALPSGGEVIQGRATFLSSSGTLQVSANGKAILHWDQFNIAAHEAVHFTQSQSGQAILNRVTSGSASEILGSLQANCSIYLINPNGVFIGSSACIDTAGFLASTADLSNEAFLQGTELLFQEFGKGRIVNLGKIHAGQGDVYLIARGGLDNQGRIEAPNGIVMLTTREMMLYPDTKECVFIRVSDAAEEGIQNSGTIQALAVELQTQSPYEKAIQHSGSIEALSTLEQNGRIYLISEGGTIVNGSLTAKSGEVRVLGQTVVLEDGAVINASGEFGGGTVLIGGDYQGKNEEIKNAKHTWVGKETVVKADALEEGNGGKIIFWSDEATLHYGKISVRGGEKSGDGGFVEVSGPILDYGGFTDALAPYGKPGTLFLDPNDIVIGAAATTGSFTGCGPPSTYTITTGTPTNQILNTALNAQLQGCSVVISTVGSLGAGPNNGSITISSPIGAAGAWSAATTLTLTAASFISISAAVTNTSASTGFTAMNFTANGVGATTNPGITLAAGGVLTAGGGNITLNGTSSTATNASHGVSIDGGSIVTTAGNITVTGMVPVGATGVNVCGLNMNTSNGITSLSGDITVSGTSNSSGNASWGFRQQDRPWSTGSSGTLTFTNCVGGIGSNSWGIVITNSGIQAPLTNGGSIIAINNIAAGAGNTTNDGGGFFTNDAITSTNGSIQITATAANLTAGTGAGRGIWLRGPKTVSGANTITLVGIGAPVGVASRGIDWNADNNPPVLTSNSGQISVTGSITGGTGSYIGISKTGGNVVSTSGPIIISGQSSSSGAGSHGVSLTAGTATGTSGTVTFSNCRGGSGPGSHGINMNASFSSAGDIRLLSKFHSIVKMSHFW